VATPVSGWLFLMAFLSAVASFAIAKL
jgi:hypothetical protein